MPNWLLLWFCLLTTFVFTLLLQPQLLITHYFIFIGVWKQNFMFYSSVIIGDIYTYSLIQIHQWTVWWLDVICYCTFVKWKIWFVSKSFIQIHQSLILIHVRWHKSPTINASITARWQYKIRMICTYIVNGIWCINNSKNMDAQHSAQT